MIQQNKTYFSAYVHMFVKDNWYRFCVSQAHVCYVWMFISRRKLVFFVNNARSELKWLTFSELFSLTKAASLSKKKYIKINDWSRFEKKLSFLGRVVQNRYCRIFHLCHWYKRWIILLLALKFCVENDDVTLNPRIKQGVRDA